LTEIKSLQAAITEQIESLKSESARATSEMDLRCMRANSILEGLEKALDQFDARTAVPIANEVQKQLAPREAVVHLASVGYSSEEISAQTGVPKSEVELIVGSEYQRTAR